MGHKDEGNPRVKLHESNRAKKPKHVSCWFIGFQVLQKLDPSSANKIAAHTEQPIERYLKGLQEWELQ